jgi:hypothetical protein
VAYIDTTPTGLCLRNGGARGVVQVTNRGGGPTLIITRVQILNDVQGAFTIARNDCDQLGGKSLIPAAICQIDVLAACPATPGTATLRIESNADNRPRYDVSMTCNL